ncbi:hypothetical protein BDW_12120 [Bdellovibrio bacteriovorus W]|nr:hypothetical protein BDW_12120 [Bdellovibrio bacteriovorus W]
MLKKVILGLAALFFIFIGGLILLMSYAFNNPDRIFDALTSVTDRVMQGQPYEENGEFFLQGIETLNIQSRSVPVKIFNHTGNTMKIKLQGKVPRFDKGPFIAENLLNSSLALQIQEPLASNWMNLNINGEEYSASTDSELTASIYIPESYAGKLEIGTASASIDMTIGESKIYEIEIQTKSGEIKNDYAPSAPTADAKVSPVVLKSISGNISVHN